MPLITVHDPDDPRLDDYRDLRDRLLRRRAGRFIIETRRLLDRLLDAGLQPLSVLVEAGRADDAVQRLADDADVFLADRQLMTRVAGFAIHTGVLAVAQRPPNPTLDELLARAGDRFTLVACSQLKETANLGAIVRTAAALGAHAMILGPQCCDPFYRRAVRVSMGAVFNLPIRRAENLHDELIRLREQHNVHAYATVLDPRATPLTDLKPAPRAALVLGHEIEGLDHDVADACDQPLTIPMQGGADSLNVAASAAVFLYALTRQSTRRDNPGHA